MTNIMKINLSDFNLTKKVFLDKANADLELGVSINAGQVTDQNITRVWTDAQGWQFSVLGIYITETKELEKLQIQSFGDSKSYIQLKTIILGDEPTFEVEKLSNAFAEFGNVDLPEADAFMQGYMGSTFNRSLTEELFDSFAKDQNYLNWLVM